MKKMYFLSMAAALMMAGSAMAQSDCENAKPWMGMHMSPTESWYTVTVQAPSMLTFNGLTGVSTKGVQVFEGCNGEPAYVMAEEVDNNNISFYLEPDVEYKLHVNPDKGEGNVFVMGNALDMSRAPEGVYCVKPIVIEPGSEGQTREVKEGTVWFQRDLAYPAPVVINSWTSGVDVTAVEARHLSYRGAVNKSSELTPNRVMAKAGVNIIGITATGVGQVLITLDAMNATSCGNRPNRAPAITLDKEMAYENAYYTQDYRFEVPEDGAYTFTNFGAEGTDFSLALMKLDENSDPQYPSYLCDFDTKPLSAKVGGDNKAEISAVFAKGDVVLLHSDAYGILESATPYMKVVKGGDGSGIASATMSADREISLSGRISDGKFSVCSYLFNEGAEVNVYDMNARKVYGSTVAPGTAEKFVELNGVPAGTYLVVVMGHNRSASAKIVVK